MAARHLARKGEEPDADLALVAVAWLCRAAAFIRAHEARAAERVQRPWRVTDLTRLVLGCIEAKFCK